MSTCRGSVVPHGRGHGRRNMSGACLAMAWSDRPLADQIRERPGSRERTGSGDANSPASVYGSTWTRRPRPAVPPPARLASAVRLTACARTISGSAACLRQPSVPSWLTNSRARVRNALGDSPAGPLGQTGAAQLLGPATGARFSASWSQSHLVSVRVGGDTGDDLFAQKVGERDPQRLPINTDANGVRRALSAQRRVDRLHHGSKRPQRSVCGQLSVRDTSPSRVGWRRRLTAVVRSA